MKNFRTNWDKNFTQIENYLLSNIKMKKDYLDDELKKFKIQNKGSPKNIKEEHSDDYHDNSRSSTPIILN